MAIENPKKDPKTNPTRAQQITYVGDEFRDKIARERNFQSLHPGDTKVAQHYQSKYEQRITDLEPAVKYSEEIAETLVDLPDDQLEAKFFSLSDEIDGLGEQRAVLERQIRQQTEDHEAQIRILEDKLSQLYKQSDKINIKATGLRAQLETAARLLTSRGKSGFGS